VKLRVYIDVPEYATVPDHVAVWKEGAFLPVVMPGAKRYAIDVTLPEPAAIELPARTAKVEG